MRYIKPIIDIKHFGCESISTAEQPTVNYSTYAADAMAQSMYSNKVQAKVVKIHDVIAFDTQTTQ